MTKQYNNSSNSGNPFAQKFDIRDYVEFDANGRAVCPNCGTEGGKKNLSVTNGGQYDGAYKCFKCGDTEAIRSALGADKPQIIPTNLVKHEYQPKTKSKYLVDLEAVKKATADLLNAHAQNSFKALAWLRARGILPEIAKFYRLGLTRAKVNNKYYPAISIPIPDEGKYHRKKRLIPWEKDNPIQEIRAWSQAGIPKTIYFTHLPDRARETWLCEGEWDAMLLGWIVKHQSPENIAVASFTCGCGSLPPQAELERLPGRVKIFYDRNDNEINGKKAGEEGAKRVAAALGDRGEIAKVPMPENCDLKGWDVSNAINAGYRFDDFEKEAREAKKLQPVSTKQNKFRKNLVSAKTIFDRAPDYVEELWTDFFSCNEMYLLAAPPRLGKSLFTLALAKAVATGTEFLGRPTKKGKVVLVSKEDAEDKLKERMIAQTWGEEEFENISFQQDFTLDDLPDLIEYLEEEQPALLVLDTLSKVRTDNLSENDSKLSAILSPLQDAAMKNEVCIVIVHHTTKSGLITESREEIFNKVRGTGSLRGVCRGMVVLTEGKDCTRLVAENGRTAPKDLKIRLNPTDLIWRDLGKWNAPNVEASQKEQVLEWLTNHQAGKVVQISEELKIHPKTTHKILTRLIAEKHIRKEGRRHSTLYYMSPIRQISTKTKLVENAKAYTEKDTEIFSTKTRNFSTKIESDQDCNEVLKVEDFDLSPPEKTFFVENRVNEGQSVEVEGKTEFDKISTNPTLSNSHHNKVINNVKQSLNNFDDFGDTTKNFKETVINDAQEEAFEEISPTRQNCTNKLLIGVTAKDEMFYRVVRELRDKVVVRRSGMSKELNLPWNDVAKYHYKVQPDQ